MIGDMIFAKMKNRLLSSQMSRERCILDRLNQQKGYNRRPKKSKLSVPPALANGHSINNDDDDD